MAFRGWAHCPALCSPCPGPAKDGVGVDEDTEVDVPLPVGPLGRPKETVKSGALCHWMLMFTRTRLFRKTGSVITCAREQSVIMQKSAWGVNHRWRFGSLRLLYHLAEREKRRNASHLFRRPSHLLASDHRLSKQPRHSTGFVLFAISNKQHQDALFHQNSKADIALLTSNRAANLLRAQAMPRKIQVCICESPVSRGSALASTY